MLRIFAHTLPLMSLWVVLGALLGAVFGVLAVMAGLRFLFPWQRLHELRQNTRWWLVVQWAWVVLWTICLPVLTISGLAITGSAFAARSLVLRENVGQVIGERVLSPVSVQLARQLQQQYPYWGDLTTRQLETPKIRKLMHQITPAILERAMAGIAVLDEHKATGLELAGRRFIKQSIKRASKAYFDHNTKFIDRMLVELERRHRNHANLSQVVCCASHLYFTPAFARWTLWWILAQALALLPLFALILALPPLSFEAFWWWRRWRLARKARQAALPSSQ